MLSTGIHVAVGADLAPAVDSSQSVEAHAPVEGNREDLVLLRTPVLALSIDQTEPVPADAAVLLEVVVGVEGTGDAVAVEDEEVLGAGGADSVVLAGVGPTLALSGRVDDFVDSASGDALASEGNLSSRAHGAEDAIMLAVSRQTLADSIAVGLAVGGTHNARLAPAILEHEAISADALIESVVVAVLVADSHAVVVPLLEALVTDTLTVDEDAVLGALAVVTAAVAVGSTDAETVPEVAGSALAQLAVKDLVGLGALAGVGPLVEERDLVDELGRPEHLVSQLGRGANPLV